MKRRMRFGIGLGLAILAGCTVEPVSQETSPTETAWVTPPVIQSVEAEGRSLTISGTASPEGRVVIRDPAGPQFAVAADARGGFRLIMPRPARNTLYLAEVQSGQARYLSPGRLLVASAPGGPIAIVNAGAPSRRFDPAPALDAVDSDGRAVILSGRAAAGSTTTVEAGVVREVSVNEDGRWTAAPPALSSSVRIAGQSFDPVLSNDGGDGLTAVAGGWRLIWMAADGTRLTTWFPARQRETIG